jgi:hypothetical protein
LAARFSNSAKPRIPTSSGQGIGPFGILNCDHG